MECLLKTGSGIFSSDFLWSLSENLKFSVDMEVLVNGSGWMNLLKFQIENWLTGSSMVFTSLDGDRILFLQLHWLVGPPWSRYFSSEFLPYCWNLIQIPWFQAYINGYVRLGLFSRLFIFLGRMLLVPIIFIHILLRLFLEFGLNSQKNYSLKWFIVIQWSNNSRFCTDNAVKCFFLNLLVKLNLSVSISESTSSNHQKQTSLV